MLGSTFLGPSGGLPVLPGADGVAGLACNRWCLNPASALPVLDLCGARWASANTLEAHRPRPLFYPGDHHRVGAGGVVAVLRYPDGLVEVVLVGIVVNQHGASPEPSAVLAFPRAKGRAGRPGECHWDGGSWKSRPQNPGEGAGARICPGYGPGRWGPRSGCCEHDDQQDWDEGRWVSVLLVWDTAGVYGIRGGLRPIWAGSILGIMVESQLL